MSQILPKTLAEKLAFNFQPKKLETDISIAAREFVEREKSHREGFEIAEIVSEQARVHELRQRNVEAKVEESVLQRMKEIEEQAYAQAYALGLQEGTDKAFKEKHDELLQRLQRFDEILGQLDHIKMHLLKENEEAFVKLVFLIGEKIAMRAIDIEPGPIAETLNNIVETLHKDENIIIRLPQTDLEFIEDLRNRKVKEVSNLQNIRLVASEDLKPTEFIVESNYGMIEASLKTRVEKVWEALKSRLPLLRGHKTDLKGKNESGDPA